MHKNFADWYAKADRAPSQEKLESRWAGVHSFLSNSSLDALLGLVRYLAGESGEEADAEGLRNEVKEKDNTFLLRDNDLEFRILAAVSLIVAIENESSKSAAVALAVDVASAVGAEEVGPLGKDLVEAAQKYLIEEAQRRRVEPKAVEVKKVKLPSLGLDEVTLPQSGADVVQLQENTDSLASSVEALNNAIKRVVPPLRTLVATQNALAASCAFNVVLAEESSLLWWLVGKHSRDAGVPLASLAKEGVCFVVGRDLADLTRIVPGPVSIRAMMHNALDSAGVDPGDELDLGDAVDALSQNYRRGWLEGRDLTCLQGIGRCLPALAVSAEVGEETNWQQLLKSRYGVLAETRLSHLSWARLCYSECLLLRQYEDWDQDDQ